jgi:putative flippase GtrA
LNKEKFLLILRFLVGGGAGVIAYYVALYTLTEFFRVWYVLSAIIAFVLNNGINFVLQKFWTFKSNDIKAVPTQIVLYFGMGVSFLVANTGLLYVLVEYVRLYYLIAQLMLTVLLTIVSFVITKRIFAK